MTKSVILENWQFIMMNHSQVTTKHFTPKTVEEVEASGCEVLPAAVPGNLELDLIRAGKLPEDIFFDTNVLEVQKLEGTHLWYTTRFTLEDGSGDDFLLFEGIDTASEVFLDGELLGMTENMLIPHEFSLAGVTPGSHELVLHIIPAAIYARDKEMHAYCRALPYNLDSLPIRKAPYMYGWDIMPRIVSAGLWRPVSLVTRPRVRISEAFVWTLELHPDRAVLEGKVKLCSDADTWQGFRLKFRGKCGNSEFYQEKRVFCSEEKLHVVLPDPKLWWPKNYGEPNLYDLEIILERDGAVCDRYTRKLGIRTVELVRTSCAGPEGTFHFKVNGKKIFVLGTNWVPTDPFPSRHDEKTLRGLELVKDLGCNMIRCWGGNAYPGDVLYDFCDENGILVWQDFSMACGLYPNDDRFCKLLRTEAEAVVRRLRDRPSLALWSGDNECDQMYAGAKILQDGVSIHQLNPNDNKLTRQVLPEVITRLDGTRPYLPSSPFLDGEVFATYYGKTENRKAPAEDHPWGPRDYFKGDFYYRTNIIHFASEIGYHGCPSPETLKKIIPEDRLTAFGDGKRCQDPNWLVHAASPETSPEGCYAYRIPLMTRQVERLFETAPADIETYALMSQISQAEAKKFFVEMFRMGKWYRCGLIWWNVIDGWPQISDAIVDWYGVKKLAYHYIKASQQPFCLMCDEPDEEGQLTLCAANDTRADVNISYRVSNAVTGEEIFTGSCTAGGDATTRIIRFPEQAISYKLEWWGDESGENHFTGRIGDGLKLEEYTEFMKNCGYFGKLEGF